MNDRHENENEIKPPRPYIPRVAIRKDGRCSSCAGRNPKQNRNGCDRCWNEYQKSRTQRERLKSQFSELRLHLQNALTFYRLKYRNENGCSATTEQEQRWGYHRQLDQLDYRVEQLPDYWKRYQALRKTGEVLPGHLFYDWYVAETKYDPREYAD